MDIDSSSHNALHSFCIRPDISFETQDRDEEVILVLRAHPITQLAWIINAVGIILLLWVLNLVLPQFVNGNQLFFFNVFIFAFVFSYVWYNFLIWYFNVGIVTNKRVIDVDFSGILYKEMSIAQLNKVEEVTSRSIGYFSSIFNYGNVFVQTAGDIVNIEFISVPNPSQVGKIINALTESAVEK